MLRPAHYLRHLLRHPALSLLCCTIVAAGWSACTRPANTWQPATPPGLHQLDYTLQTPEGTFRGTEPLADEHIALDTEHGATLSVADSAGRFYIGLQSQEPYAAGQTFAQWQQGSGMPAFASALYVVWQQGLVYPVHFQSGRVDVISADDRHVKLQFTFTGTQARLSGAATLPRSRPPSAP